MFVQYRKIPAVVPHAVVAVEAADMAGHHAQLGLPHTKTIVCHRAQMVSAVILAFLGCAFRLAIMVALKATIKCHCLNVRKGSIGTCATPISATKIVVNNNLVTIAPTAWPILPRLVNAKSIAQQAVT